MVRSNSTGERRQLTLMFCDLVGSTALSERLDPEDLRDVLVAYREAATRTAIGNGGSIVNYAGDGIMFAFGYPQAHEDDAARSVHAALRLIEETTRLGTKAAHLAQGPSPTPSSSAARPSTWSKVCSTARIWGSAR
jgi:class 3 adenylate cyclase